MTGQYYQPEVGQMLFGQPCQRFAASDMLDAALRLISNELDRILINRLQRQADSPFDNSGATFDTEGLSIHAYSWDDETEQAWNLKCGSVEVSWYKHSWRGLSVNCQMSNDDIAAFLDAALSILRKCDVDFGHGYGPHRQPGEQVFRYCGEEVGESNMHRAVREEREAEEKRKAIR